MLHSDHTFMIGMQEGYDPPKSHLVPKSVFCIYRRSVFSRSFPQCLIILVMQT